MTPWIFVDEWASPTLMGAFALRVLLPCPFSLSKWCLFFDRKNKKAFLQSLIGWKDKKSVSVS